MSLPKIPTSSYHVLIKNWLKLFCQPEDSLLDPNLPFTFIPQSTQANTLLQSQPTWVVQFYLWVFSSREILQFWVALSLPLHIFAFLKIYLLTYSSIWVDQVLVADAGTWDLVSDHKSNPGPPAWAVQSLSHWISREVPPLHIFQSPSSSMAQRKSSVSPLASLAPQGALASFSEFCNTDCSVFQS